MFSDDWQENATLCRMLHRVRPVRPAYTTAYATVMGGHLLRYTIEIIPITGLPIITGPTDLADVLAAHFASGHARLESKDILVLAHKIVSKAEGRVVDLRAITPGPLALSIASTSGKDARLVEMILRESEEIVRAEGPHIIARTRHGFICANAGIDHSNVANSDDIVCLLPEAPDLSAERIRRAIAAKLSASVAVLIIDTHGRPFRNGAVGVCIGCSGLNPLRSLVGQRDLFGYVMRSSVEAIADEVAAAATLSMGQCAEAVPAVVIRGLRYDAGEQPATALVRHRSLDLFSR